MRSPDPNTMTPAERRSEIAAILARGYLRHLVARQADAIGPGSAQDSLALDGEPKAQCAPPHDSPTDDEDAA